MTFLLRFFFVFTLFLPQLVEAKLFRNSYVSFELPPRWKCNAEGTEWICRSQLKTASREAIIILTAKEKGPSDTLNQYATYLKRPKTYPGKKGKPFTSTVKNTKTRKVNDHDWVDSLHLGSEIPIYYTRYLATIKNQVAVLVTFSAHKRYYTKYSSDFFKAIQSLRVIAPKNTANMNLRPGNEVLGGNIGSTFPGDMIIEDEEFPEELSEPSSGKNMLLLFGFLLLGAGAYFFISKKKK